MTKMLLTQNVPTVLHGYVVNIKVIVQHYKNSALNKVLL